MYECHARQLPNLTISPLSSCACTTSFIHSNHYNLPHHLSPSSLIPFSRFPLPSLLFSLSPSLPPLYLPPSLSSLPFSLPLSLPTQHLSQLDSWCSEQSQTELEPSSNTLDSQLQLDTLQGQYNDLFSTHNDIAIRARSVARETEQLDSIMFGSTPGPTHPVVVIVDELEVKMTEAGEKLEGVVRPRLKQLKDCLDYHLLQQRAHTLTSALHTITTSISLVSPVGHSLSSAETVLQQQNNNHQKLQVRGLEGVGWKNGWGWGWGWE